MTADRPTTTGTSSAADPAAAERAAEVEANMRAEIIADTLARYPEPIQIRLIQMVGLIAGMSHDEKVATQTHLADLRRSDVDRANTCDVLTSLELLVWSVDRVATPTRRTASTGTSTGSSAGSSSEGA